MVRTRSMAAVVRSRNLIKTKAAPPKSKSKRKAATPKSKRKAAQLKRKAASSAEEAKMMKALSAVDAQKIITIKRDALEAIETKCFPLTAAAAAAAAGEAEPSAAGKEKIPEKKKKVVTYLVSQRYIDHLKSGLFNCVDEIPEDKLAQKSQRFRDAYRANVLLSEKLRACQQVLLDQYDKFGYAYDAKEVTDDEAEGQEAE